MRWFWASCVAIGLVACGNGGGGNGKPDAAGIDVPLEQWTWVPIDGMRCGNGSPAGIGVNLTERSRDVLVYFEGGGACWDATTCFAVKSAINIEVNYGESQMQTDTARLSQSYLVQRGGASPFANASWIYVPYCTGDLHDGTRAATYDVFGTPRMVHHVGGLNADLVFAHVSATRPDAQTVWLLGVSAGGYGVGFNVAGARAAWPDRPVHVLADSSQQVTIESTRWSTMQREWAMRFPAACTGCGASLSAMPAALAAEAPAGHRYGLLAYTRDQTISLFFGVGLEELRTRTLAQQAAMTGDQAAFLIDSTDHVMLVNPAQQAGGMTVAAWIQGWASGASTWGNVGP
jgi:hypothetical protein